MALAVACGPASAALLSVQGDARDPASERLLYREDHLIRRQGDAPVERVVLYRCPDGTAFARKRVDYRVSRTAPDFVLVDARDGHREGLRREGDGIALFSGDKRATLADAGTRTLVADAGFDEFLRQRWDALDAQGAVPIRFAVPAFGKPLDFTVRNTGTTAIDGSPVREFRLRLDGMLGVIAPEIRVAYAADGRHLRRFVGVTNIRGDRGKQVKARIDFPAPPRAADAAQWQQALSTTLRPCTLGA